MIWESIEGELLRLWEKGCLKIRQRTVVAISLIGGSKCDTARELFLKSSPFLWLCGTWNGKSMSFPFFTVSMFPNI